MKIKTVGKRPRQAFFSKYACSHHKIDIHVITPDLPMVTEPTNSPLHMLMRLRNVSCLTPALAFVKRLPR